jgi:multidrug efflux pump subunit AcrA (membrane-fusion protein)
MPEISARDLRRLESLDTKLRKAQESQRKQASEARSLRGRLQAAERASATADSRLQELLAENQQLAAQVESTTADLERAATSGEEARTRADQATAEAEAAGKRAAEAEARAKRLQSEAGKLGERIKVAEAQLEGKGVDPVVPASRVAELVDVFIDELRGGLGGLDVNRGELRLKVGMAVVDDKPGFVLPTAASSEETVNALQEVTLRFDRRLE